MVNWVLALLCSFAFLKKIVWFIFSLSIVQVHLLGQGQAFYKKLHDNDILSSNTIYSVFQTAKGRVYVGHEKGLAIWNGLSFEAATIEGGTRAIGEVIETEDGYGYAQSFYGELYAINGNKCKVLLNSETQNLKGFAFFAKNKDTLLAAYENVLFAIVKNKIVARVNASDLGLSAIYRVVLFKGKSYFLGSNGKGQDLLYELNLKGKQKLTDTWIGASGNKDFAVLDGRLYVLNRSNMEMRDVFNSHVVKQMAVPKNVKVTQIEVYNNKLLIATFSGLFIFNKNFELITRIFENKQISEVYADIEGNIWCGTWHEGIMLMPDLETKIINLDQDGLGKTSTYYTANGLLALGTYNGRVLFFDSTGTLVRNVDINRKSEVQSICYHPGIDKWIIASDNIYSWDMKSNHLENNGENMAPKDVKVKGMDVFVATSHGVYNLQSKKRYLHDYWVKSMYILKDESQMLLQTNRGIKWWNSNTDILKQPESKNLQNAQSVCSYFNTLVLLCKWLII